MATATYSYRVKDRQGSIHSGTMDGLSTTAVARALRDRGFVPLAVEEESSSALQKEIKIPGLSGRVKVRDLAVFSRQFATMTNSGLSLLRSLSVLEEQTENKALANIIGEVKGDVERGSSLSAALEKHPKAFGKLYVSMIKAGEVGGVLDETLDRLADTLEAQVALRAKVKSAMTYPVVVFSLVILIVIAMLIFVVPMFEDLYRDLGGTLPLPTQILLGVSRIITKFWYIALLLVAGIAWAFRRWISSEQGRAHFDLIKLKLPVFGGLVHKTAISRFARTLSVLVRTGVPILQAMDIVAETSGNAVVSRAITDVQSSVREGESLAEPLTQHPVFPPMVVQMMAVGEETGALDTMLGKVADFYDREVEATVDALTSLIEPLLIVVMGLTVGGMLIALYMPMFNVVNLIE
ncbi:MAG: type II secretion system F family protein [Actinomycetota bacterium]|nr:type II secretion system F family protein [Actinomycetota bacterium]